MKGRSKKILFVLVVILLSVGIIYLATPRPLVESVEELEIWHVTAIGEDSQRMDITDTVDIEGLKQGLMDFSCSRIPVFMDHYLLDDAQYEVDGLYGGKPFHIITGRINYVYISGDQGFYEIRRGTELAALIDALTAE